MSSDQLHQPLSVSRCTAQHVDHFTSTQETLFAAAKRLDEAQVLKDGNAFLVGLRGDVEASSPVAKDINFFALSFGQEEIVAL